MSNFQSSPNLIGTREDQGELVILTTEQYLAVADDFLRRLSPELAPHLLPCAAGFTLFIKDDDYVPH